MDDFYYLNEKLNELSEIVGGVDDQQEENEERLAELERKLTRLEAQNEILSSIIANGVLASLESVVRTFEKLHPDKFTKDETGKLTLIKGGKS